MRNVTLGASGTQVSQLCLGTMYFGSRVGRDDSYALLDRYWDAGGRFLDTANNYCFWLGDFTGDESETLLGQWMAERKNRDQVFLSTKFGVRPTGKPGEFEGLSAAAVRAAIEGSLRRLRTDYIDLYSLHVDWRDDPLEETLEALSRLVEEGKVRHIGCSNIATWRVMRGREISRRNDWPGFVSVQQWFSYLKPRDKADLWVQRFVDDELLDYCATESEVSIMAYSSTLGGAYRWGSIYERNHPALGTRFFSEDNERRLAALQSLAVERNVSPFQVLFAWMIFRRPYVIPVLGVRTPEQLDDNLGALDLTLSEEEFASLENAAYNGRDYQDPQEVSLL